MRRLAASSPISARAEDRLRNDVAEAFDRAQPKELGRVDKIIDA
jgi:hypothetical protein